MITNNGNPWIAHVTTLFTGIAGGYILHVLIARRAEKKAAMEKNLQVKEQFKIARERMPELILEMKKNLSQHGNKRIREFVMWSKKDPYHPSPERPCFVYNVEDHNNGPWNLMTKLNSLEKAGFIRQVFGSSIDRFKMTEQFVKLVLRS